MQPSLALLGATYVPVDREMPAERSEVVLAEVNAEACFSRFALNTHAAIIRVVTMHTNKEKFIVAPGPDPDDNAYNLYTSGSTGKPKGILITGKFATCTRGINFFNIRPDDRVYKGFSVSFDSPLFVNN